MGLSMLANPATPRPGLQWHPAVGAAAGAAEMGRAAVSHNDALQLRAAPARSIAEGRNGRLIWVELINVLCIKGKLNKRK